MIHPSLDELEGNPNPNQYWKYYKKDTNIIIVCFQDTYQTLNGNKMGWITAWLESPNITDEIRGEASMALTDAIYPLFDYVWLNKEWTDNNPIWKKDGTFHWYRYQWISSITIGKSYCLLNA
jgi:hypothetical protein